ncbi:MAG: chorismate mutase/prephenate dehydratase [Symbiobacteriaceae bacterium]|jgi:prephenate dehydratase/chorismate mutase/prephenate dehydratase|nr:chorismate mutase/prephenate dehydratase [Symbiobacteriaceae bacterium]
MTTVAFQGEHGAYGEEAIFRGFGRTATPLPCKSFADTFAAVAGGAADYGLVPVENSQAGTINDVYDLLRSHDLHVVGEVCHPVDHCLMALPGQALSEITRVISHPQALAQVDAYLRTLGVEVVATYDTAGSAKQIREEQLRGVAAVAGAGAAERYGLEILARSIQTVKENVTRFVKLSRAPGPVPKKPAKTMLMLGLAHQPGSLYRVLGLFAKAQANLLKLESRPSRNRPWEYVFYLDLEGDQADPPLAAALEELHDLTAFCKVLGSFERDLQP